jgi:hypothetical protein
MAATEVIHFPVCVQLSRGATIQADACCDSTVSPLGSPPHFLDPLPARPDNTGPTADGGLCA